MLKIFNKRIMKLSKIKIQDEFKIHEPRLEKMLDKLTFCIKHKRFEQPIIVNKQNILIDGYTTYILASQMGKKYMVVEKV